MITLNSDFMNYSDNPVGMENINTEDIFHIDVNSRQIIIPDSWTAVGALQDHLAEKIWFAIDRFFDDRDFATATRFSINFLNAASDGYIHNSTEVYKWDEVNNTVIAIDNTEDDDPMVYNKILFRWRISQNVTVKTGKVLFSVRIGKYETLNDSVEATPDQDETTWMWNTTIASLGVLESVAVEAGVDSEGNEWGVNDMARWFYALSSAQQSLYEFVDLYTNMEHVTAGPKGEYTWNQFVYNNGEITPVPSTAEEPPFEVNNDVLTVTEDGYTRLKTATWHNDMWINTSTATYTTAVVPEINDASTSSLEDTWSANKIYGETTAVKDYADSKIYSTTAGSGTTGAWAVNPTTAYIQAQFGTSSATAATSGMSAQGVRQYVSYASLPKTDPSFTNSISDNSCTASGLHNAAFGYNTTADADTGAFAEGDSTHAGAAAAHAEGTFTEATGIASHVEGVGTTATSMGAHAEGRQAYASSTAAHAEGWMAEATNIASHAEGNNTRASGYNAHAEGDNTTASGSDSHAQGLYTIANQDNQMVIGKYNSTVADTAFIIGNGTNSVNLSNAFVVDWNGNTTAAGDMTINYGGTAFDVGACLSTASGGLPEVTTADVGKMLLVNSQGQWILEYASGYYLGKAALLNYLKNNYGSVYSQYAPYLDDIFEKCPYFALVRPQTPNGEYKFSYHVVFSSDTRIAPIAGNFSWSGTEYRETTNTPSYSRGIICSDAARSAISNYYAYVLTVHSYDGDRFILAKYAENDTVTVDTERGGLYFGGATAATVIVRAGGTSLSYVHRSSSDYLNKMLLANASLPIGYAGDDEIYEGRSIANA